jgi:hypothetical protein
VVDRRHEAFNLTAVQYKESYRTQIAYICTGVRHVLPKPLYNPNTWSQSAIPVWRQPLMVCDDFNLILYVCPGGYCIRLLDVGRPSSCLSLHGFALRKWQTIHYVLLVTVHGRIHQQPHEEPTSLNVHEYKCAPSGALQSAV